jgi:branched-subunit amino acid transport protein
MIWAVMIFSGLVTFAARFSMIGMFKDRSLPHIIRQLLTYIAPAALAAIILPAVLIVEGQLALSDNPQLPAFIIAVAVALFTRNVIVIIASGMAALWLITALF